MDLQSGWDGVATLGDTACKVRLHGSGVIMRWSQVRVKRNGRPAMVQFVLLSSRASFFCEARDLGVLIRAGARKARIPIQTAPTPGRRSTAGDLGKIVLLH